MDIFKCGICFERYDEDEKRVPRTLTECGHTICEICALKLLNNAKIVCPFDRIESIVRDGNITFLKKNFAILEVIQEQLYKTKNVETEHDGKYEAEKALGIPCDEDPSHIAVLYCTKCEAHYCERCSILFHSSKTQSSHKMVKVSEKPEPLLYCSHHSYNVAELYCLEKDCEIKNKVTCAHCHLHGPHKSHAYKLIDEVYNAKMKETCETLKHTDTNIEIVRSFINDIGTLPESIREDREYIDARNKIGEIYEKRWDELHIWKQSNMEILEKEAKAKIESKKREKEYYCSKLEELETLKRECSNAKQLKKTEYLEKLEEIEIIKEKLKSFEIKESDEPTKPLLDHLILNKCERYATVILYAGYSPKVLHQISEGILHLGGIELETRRFKFEGQTIEVFDFDGLKNCRNRLIDVFVILSFESCNNIKALLGERKNIKTDGIVIFGHKKEDLKKNGVGYWNNNIAEIATYLKVPLLFATQDDPKFVENILKGNHLENPFFETYP